MTTREGDLSGFVYFTRSIRLILILSYLISHLLAAPVAPPFTFLSIDTRYLVFTIECLDIHLQREKHHVLRLFNIFPITMSGSENLSDDYVAQLLAKDAKTSNAKYSAYGLQELLPRR